MHLAQLGAVQRNELSSEFARKDTYPRCKFPYSLRIWHFRLVLDPWIPLMWFLKLDSDSILK